METTSLYHVDSRKCICKGRGLIPIGDGKNHAFCPIHRVQRYWPQLQANGKVQFKRLRKWGIE